MKRTKYDIYADILTYLAIVGEERITKIARFANLPLDRARIILEMMCSNGLIRKIFKDNYCFYRISRRGYEYIALYKRLRLLVGL